MTSSIISDIIEKVVNPPKKTAFILDSSFVFGQYNVQILNEINDATLHVFKVNNLLNEAQTIVVPLEVREEIDEGIGTISHINGFYEGRADNLRQRRSAIHKYTSALKVFQEKSTGRDPRACQVGLVKIIDTDSRQYQDAWESYHNEVFLTHKYKQKPPSIADISVNTLAYLIQRQGIVPCILTRDYDFIKIAEKTRIETNKKIIYLKNGKLMHITGANYEICIYHPIEGEV
ncbi:hypothetical protein FJZ18_00170 [Candidatus Pacearchaeota archaeon]|nr:hypothetical protein [Candidatus Pacearchaeota archaeon]